MKIILSATVVVLMSLNAVAISPLRQDRPCKEIPLSQLSDIVGGCEGCGSQSVECDKNDWNCQKLIGFEQWHTIDYSGVSSEPIVVTGLAEGADDCSIIATQQCYERWGYDDEDCTNLISHTTADVNLTCTCDGTCPEGS